jgi:hypothetical protein
MGEVIFVLIIIGLIGFYLYRVFTEGKMEETPEYFKQGKVTVEYKTQKIKIGKQAYDVSQVTGISSNTKFNGRRERNHVQIEVDDLRHPVHFIPVIGGRPRADQLNQRICVAIRKAGGPNFR